MVLDARSKCYIDMKRCYYFNTYPLFRAQKNPTDANVLFDFEYLVYSDRFGARRINL